jgi:hypothetical protein
MNGHRVPSICCAGALVVLSLALGACGRGSATGSAVEEKRGPSVLDSAGEARLAAAYHGIRCALVGGAAVPDGLYRQFGFPDAAGYLDAFRSHAAVRPEWAKATVAASFAASCTGAGAGLPVSPTATSAPVR